MMIAARRDQENAVHAHQTATLAKHLSSKAAVPKTPLRQPSKLLSRQHKNDENATNIKRSDGKVKDAVAVLEGKAAKTNNTYNTPAAPKSRAPLGAKATNVKATAFQTPAPTLTLQRPIAKTKSPRVRRAKFQVHNAQHEVQHTVAEEREIEIMHPREEPLPDHPDDDLWPHDRLYPQFEGSNFTKGWALDILNDDESSDFESRMKHFETSEANKTQEQHKPVEKVIPGAITRVKAATALSSVHGIGNFATATSSSAARTKTPSAAVVRKRNDKPTHTSNIRHTVAKNVSNTTLGYSKGRRVSAANQGAASIHDTMASTDDDQQSLPVTPAERRQVLDAFWTYATINSTVLAPTMSILDLDELHDLQLNLPDD